MSKNDEVKFSAQFNNALRFYRDIKAMKASGEYGRLKSIIINYKKKGNILKTLDIIDKFYGEADALFTEMIGNRSLDSFSNDEIKTINGLIDERMRGTKFDLLKVNGVSSAMGLTLKLLSSEADNILAMKNANKLMRDYSKLTPTIESIDANLGKLLEAKTPKDVENTIATTLDEQHKWIVERFNNVFNQMSYHLQNGQEHIRTRADLQKTLMDVQEAFRADVKKILDNLAANATADASLATDISNKLDEAIKNYAGTVNSFSEGIDGLSKKMEELAGKTLTETEIRKIISENVNEITKIVDGVVKAQAEENKKEIDDVKELIKQIPENMRPIFEEKVDELLKQGKEYYENTSEQIVKKGKLSKKQKVGAIVGGSILTAALITSLAFNIAGFAVHKDDHSGAVTPEDPRIVFNLDQDSDSTKLYNEIERTQLGSVVSFVLDNNFTITPNSGIRTLSVSKDEIPNVEDYDVDTVAGKREYTNDVINTFKFELPTPETTQQMIDAFGADDMDGEFAQNSTSAAQRFLNTLVDYSTLRTQLQEAYERVTGNSAENYTSTQMIQALENAPSEQIDEIYKSVFPDGKATTTEQKKEELKNVVKESHLAGDLLTQEQKDLLDLLKKSNNGKLPTTSELSSMLNQYSEEEINDLYQQYIGGSETNPSKQKAAIQSYIEGLISNQESHSAGDILTKEQKDLLDLLKQANNGKLPTTSELNSMLNQSTEEQIANLYHTYIPNGQETDPSKQRAALQNYIGNLIANQEKHDSSVDAFLQNLVTKYESFYGNGSSNNTSYLAMLEAVLNSVAEGEIRELYRALYPNGNATNVNEMKEAIKNADLEKHTEDDLLNDELERKLEKYDELTRQLLDAYNKQTGKNLKELTPEMVEFLISSSNDDYANTLYGILFPYGNAKTIEEKKAALESIVQETHNPEEIKKLQDLVHYLVSRYESVFGVNSAKGVPYTELIDKLLAHASDAVVNEIYEALFGGQDSNLSTTQKIDQIKSITKECHTADDLLTEKDRKILEQYDALHNALVSKYKDVLKKDPQNLSDLAMLNAIITAADTAGANRAIEEVYRSLFPQGKATTVEQKKQELLGIVQESHNSQDVQDAMKKREQFNELYNYLVKQYETLNGQGSSKGKSVNELVDGIIKKAKDVEVNEIYESLFGDSGNGLSTAEKKERIKQAQLERHSEEQLQQYQNAEKYLKELYKFVFKEEAPSDINEAYNKLKNYIYNELSRQDAESAEYRELVESILIYFGYEPTGNFVYDVSLAQTLIGATLDQKDNNKDVNSDSKGFGNGN